MIALDASALIAHLSERDPHHAHATELLSRSADEAFVIHPLNLAEVLVGGVRGGYGRQLLADIEALGVTVRDDWRDEPLRLAALRVESGLKLPDCCALGTAVAGTCPLATFDARLAAAARRLRVPVVPEEEPVVPEEESIAPHEDKGI